MALSNSPWPFGHLSEAVELFSEEKKTFEIQTFILKNWETWIGGSGQTFFLLPQFLVLTFAEFVDFVDFVAFEEKSMNKNEVLWNKTQKSRNI